VKKVLIADDDESIRWVLKKTVSGMGFAPDLAEDGEKALALLTRNTYAAAFIDIRMPAMEGIEVLERIQARKSPTRFFIMTAVRRPDAAARSTRAGAAEFITKPFDIAHIESLLRDVTKESASRERPFRTEEAEDWKSARIVGRSRAILDVFLGVGKVADSDATVLLLGERGVGKELVARGIHELGTPEGPFVAVNASAIPKTLQEAELFGFEKGAFTGANTAREGKLEAASGGTLFLDEVGDIPTDLQAKLLRVLQEKEFSRLGSNQDRKFRGRIIAATNRDLGRMVADGKFREDLFDRLNVFPIRVPPLSERREDIPLLADFFLQKYCAILSRPPRSFSKEALEVMASHHWKGNVRELENFVQRLAVLSTGKLLRREEVARELAKAGGAPDLSTAPLEQVIEERIREFVGRLGKAIESEDDLHGYFLRQMEKPLIKIVLEATGGNQVKAAAILGINRNTLRKKLSSLSLLPGKGTSRQERDGPAPSRPHRGGRGYS
jgi:two-component system nitrogen regulation response regulator GlnG